MADGKEIGYRVQLAGMAADPFTLLGLSPAFELNADEVQRRYLERAARLHPDVAAAGSGGRATDVSDVADSAAILNDARAVLADPEKRASALLTLLGGPGSDQEKSLPVGFLLEIMEVREGVEQAARTRDPGKMSEWHRWARARRAEYIGEVGAKFRHLLALPAEGRSEPALVDVRRVLNAWRYIERLRDQLEG